MRKRFLVFAAVAGAVAVLLGAMGAHALRSLLSPSQLDVFETGVRYQFYHVFALLACGLLSGREKNKMLRLAGNFFMAGILLFCGSLYLITCLEYKSVAISPVIGILTPLGGLFFIAGWLCMAFGVPRSTQG
jgi:uncharacterized membrane protein YgdD (TMEM256/DUF423 family)